MSDGTVSQIDRASGRTVATIAVADPKVLRAQGCAPDSVHAYYSGSWGWRACDTPYAIGWDGSSLWALDNGNRQLVRVDPSAHRAAERVQLPGTGWSLAFGNGKAWVSGYDDHALYAVDLATRTLAGTIADLDHGPAMLTDGAGAERRCWPSVVSARDGGERRVRVNRQVRVEDVFDDAAHNRRVTKDPSNHGHWNSAGVVDREEAASDHASHIREFPARVIENLRGDSI